MLPRTARPARRSAGASVPRISKSTAIAAALFAAFALWQGVLAAHGNQLFGDFRAYYCAGSAVAHHADPYAAAALTACEHAQTHGGFYAAPQGVTVPAPFPAYVLAVFSVLSLLPYGTACLVWAAVLAGAIVVAVRAISKLTARPAAGTLALLTVGMGAIVLPYGQLAAIEIAALASFAMALRERRWTAAAVAAAFCALVPHAGAPALLCTFLFVKPMRARLLLTGCALALLDVAAGGVPHALQYFTEVLPAHAASEIGRTSQYGATWAAHALGASDRAALEVGNAWYAGMCVLGILAARTLVRRGDLACAAIVPPAFAVFGGVFVHYTEILAAVPAALLLCATMPDRRKPAAVAAALLAGIPWAICLNQPLLLLLFGAAAAAFVAWFANASVPIAVRTGMACTALGALLVTAAARLGPGVVPAHAAIDAAQVLAQHSWTQYVAAHWSGTGAIWWLAKAPTWIGLALLLFLTARGSQAVADEDLVLRVVVKHAPAGP